METLNILETSGNDPRLFWSTVRISLFKDIPPCTISVERWYEHFYTVFNADCEISTSTVSAHNPEDVYSHNSHETDWLDRDITLVEVEEAVKKLKVGKASGSDGISGEFYKFSEVCII